MKGERMMKKNSQLHEKGRASGVLLGGMLVIVGYMLGTMHDPKRAEAVQGAAEPSGRFALVAAGEDSAWKIDTSTGKAWRSLRTFGWGAVPDQLNVELLKRMQGQTPWIKDQNP